MQFIKENKFLIGAVVGTILLSCVFLVMASSTADSVTISLTERDKTKNDLAGFDNRKDFPNQESVNINKAFVTGIKTQVTDSKQITVDWNKKRYIDQIIEVTDKELGKVKAFPPDMPKFSKYGLYLPFRKEYSRLRDKAVKGLGVLAEEPTATDVEARLPYFRKVVEYNDRRSNPASMPATAPAATPAAPAAGAPAAAAPPAGAAAPAGAAQPVPAYNPSVDERARQLARQALREEKALTGEIYYPKDVVDNLFPNLDDTSDLKPDDMKNAQLFLWVLNDIVESISTTNKEAYALPETQALMSKAGHQKPCVIYSAIKKVEKITINLARTTPTALTGRVSNAEQTVIGYTIKMIMPMSKFSMFQANLLKLNYHTLTNVQADAFQISAEALYDYGFEPVWTFNIEGEVIFKAAWERDLWKPVGVQITKPK